MTLEVGRQSGISLVEILSFENSFLWTAPGLEEILLHVQAQLVSTKWPLCGLPATDSPLLRSGTSALFDTISPGWCAADVGWLVN